LRPVLLRACNQTRDGSWMQAEQPGGVGGRLAPSGNHANNLGPLARSQLRQAARHEGRIGGRRPKLSAQQQSEIRKMITKGDKTAADAARLFKVHPATVSRLLARAPASGKVKYAK
jgi:hypothetical protein